ncbi:MAG: shikimate dehydrogenase [Flavobacteriaceae bacterium]|nr:shikimate dehydrogenase [Flavobacteriaceae bacterium]
MDMSKKKQFGLLGKNISYSFSKKYFTEKFKNLQLENYSYKNFDLQQIDDFLLILNENMDELKGLNVTIPYKEEVFKYLDELDEDAKTIGAVNTIKVIDDHRLKGFNTDAYGFENSLKPLLQGNEKHALILGTGGASKAVAFVLNKLKISFNFVSRVPKKNNSISYNQLNEQIIKDSLLIINCTPLGTYPNIENLPNIPYNYLTSDHILYDLIYNPALTSFLQKGKEMGCSIKNGGEMLQLQADRSWEIWNS